MCALHYREGEWQRMGIVRWRCSQPKYGKSTMRPSFVLCGALVGAALTTPVYAQTYPTKPVRLIIPFAPGGGTDLIGRVAGQKLSEAFKVQFIPDNRPGAGSTVGVEIGVKSPPDGYTLTVIAGSYGVNPSLYKLNFDPVSDITPIIQLSQGPFLVAVTPSLPAKNIKDLIALGKSKPDALSYASSGAGSIVHLASAFFLSTAGIKAVHIPYKGTGPALTDTMAGNTQFIFGSMGPTLPIVRSGRLRGIAVTSLKRIPPLPDTPAIAEHLKGFEALNWHALVGPKGLPQPLVERLNAELNKALKSKEMEEKLSADGVFPAGGTPDQLVALIRRDIQKWAKVVKETGAKASD
jgi:tripartite-type tricarboxylate transporter receptor subunit TctC